MFRGESSKSFLQEATGEIRIMRDDEDNPVEQIVDGSIVDAVTGDHLIGNAGDLRDLGRDARARIFQPFPGAENFIDPPALTVIFNRQMPSSMILSRSGSVPVVSTSTTAATSFGWLSGGWYSAFGSSRLVTR